MGTVNRSRVFMVATALVLMVEGEAFVLPSGFATQRNSIPGTGDTEQSQQHHKLVGQQPLRSFKFIKGETSYGDLSEGSIHNGMLGGPSSVGFGGASVGGNSLSRGNRRGRMGNPLSYWWSSSSAFSRTTPTTLLAVGSLESWPVLEADDIQVLVRKGEDLDDDVAAADSRYGASSTSSSVRATLERWERDISLEVVGLDGYPMLGNEMQPGQYSNNGYDDGSGRCTQSIKFDVTDGDLYPFSGTISVPPPLTVEDSMGNQQTVMMVLNNPDDENDQGMQFQQQQYDDYGNEIPASKPSSVEAKLEPLYKSPDEKYAEAQQQQQQQQQQPQYDEYGNEMYNPLLEQQQDQKTMIPSQGYQSFELDATDPATGKIKISLEREEENGGFGGAFGGGGNGGSSSSEARVEIYHGFKDQYGNPYNINMSGDEEEDRRISIEVSTMHPTFSSVVDTMPANLLAKHALPSIDNLSFVQPYLEVRIVNTGGAALKAGVQSFLPQYKPQNQKEREKQQYERQKYQQRMELLQNPSLGGAKRVVKADDPFLLVDSAQSTTSARRMSNNVVGTTQKTYVRASSSNSNRNTRINQMWSTGSSNNQETPMPRPSQERYGGQFGNGAIRADQPGDNLLRDRSVQQEVSNNDYVMQSRRNNRIDYDYNYDYGYDAIDITPKTSTSLVANNDFSMANGSKNSSFGSGSKMMIAGSPSGNYRRVSSSSLQSFGGNSGNASGMQKPFQGRSQQQSMGGMFQGQQSFGNDGMGGNSGIGGGTGMFQGRSQQQQQQQSFGNDGMGGNSGAGGGSGMFQGRSQQQQSFGNNGMGGNSGMGGGSGMFQGRSQQQQSFGNSGMGGNSGTGGGSGMFQGRSQQQQQQQQQSFGNSGMGETNPGFGSRSGMQQQSFGNDGTSESFGIGDIQQAFQGRSQQQAFSQQTSPQMTRSLQGRTASQTQGNGRSRSSSAFSGNGNVIGNGVIAGRPASNNNRMMQNNNSNEFGTDGSEGFSRNGFQERSNTRNMNGNNQFGGGKSSFESSFTPPASNNFGGGDASGFGDGNSNNFMGSSMKQRMEGNDSFSSDFGNSRQQQQRGGNGGRILNNPFGGNNNNNNQQQQNGGRMNNSFGENNNNNDNNFGNSNQNNSGAYGGASKGSSGRPFGNLGTPPQTKGNSINPFAKLNGEKTQQTSNSGFGSNDYNDYSNNGDEYNSFGGNGGGGAPQRPLSPSPSAMKNPFSGLNGNNRQGPGGSTTAMRSSNNNYGASDKNENPIMGFAKNIVKGISDYGNR